MLTFSVKQICPFHFPHTTHDQPTRCGASPRRELANCCDKSPHHPQALTCNSVDRHGTQQQKSRTKEGCIPENARSSVAFPPQAEHSCIGKSVIFYRPLLEVRETQVRLQINAPPVHRLPLLTSKGAGNLTQRVARARRPEKGSKERPHSKGTLSQRGADV